MNSFTHTGFTDDDELMNSVPHLAEMRKENPFQVPSGYFDALPSIIQERCINESKSSFKIWLQNLLNLRFAKEIMHDLLTPQISLVLTLAVVIFVMFNYPFKTMQTGNDEITLDEIVVNGGTIKTEDILNSPLINEIDDDILIETLAGKAADASFKSNDNIMEEYLIEHNVDISLITSEL